VSVFVCECVSVLEKLRGKRSGKEGIVWYKGGWCKCVSVSEELRGVSRGEEGIR
jgi:hypothetical protein